MKKGRNGLLILSAAASSLALASCGGNNGGTASAPPVTPPPPAATKDLDTAAVLAIVQTMTSDTAAPFQVDKAAVVVTPVGDETGTPISVNVM